MTCCCACENKKQQPLFIYVEPSKEDSRVASLDLSLMTVIELRKLAKEKNVRLGAGLSKEGIIQKLSAALEAEAPACGGYARTDDRGQDGQRGSADSNGGCPCNRAGCV